MPIFRGEGDPVATVVDWLDACRNRRICALLELYDEAATIDARATGGRAWPAGGAGSHRRPKLAAPSPGCFAMDDVAANTRA